MNLDIQASFDALANQWRGRARHFMEEAEQTRRPADMIRLTAMASTLEWAGSDLSWIAKSPQLAGLLVATSGRQHSPECE